MRRWADRVITLLLWAYALPMLLGLGIVLTYQADLAVIELAKTAYWLVLWSLLPALILGLLLRKWRLALLMAPLAGAFIFYYTPYWVSAPSSAPPGQNVAVMTYNILTPDEDLAGIARIIREGDAAVVAVQELSIEVADYLQTQLADVYPYMALHPQEPHFRGQGVFSRYPILEDDYWQYTDRSRMPYTDVLRSHGYQRVVLEINGREVVLYNAHPWPPQEWEGGLQFTIEPEADRDHQVAVRRVLNAALAEGDMPLLLLGDFNMTDQFTEYDLITAHFTDSQVGAGHGPGYTYPAQFPLIRLDYIFHSAHFSTRHARTLPDAGPSDHLPVWAVVRFPDGKNAVPTLIRRKHHADVCCQCGGCR